MLLINEQQFFTEEATDEVLTEVIKKLIPNKTKAKLSSKKNRQLMLEKYGKDAFLLPDQLKFPVRNPDTGKLDCSLIYAARVRAKQYSGVKPGYREVAAKAEKLYEQNKCNIKLNIRIHDGEEGFDIDLENLINKYSLENKSNTPDFILADYLISCLKNFEKTSRRREKWYRKPLHI